MQARELQAVSKARIFDKDFMQRFRRDLRYIAIRFSRKARDFLKGRVRESEEVPQDIVDWYNRLVDKLSPELHKELLQDSHTPSPVA